MRERDSWKKYTAFSFTCRPAEVGAWLPNNVAESLAIAWPLRMDKGDVEMVDAEKNVPASDVLVSNETPIKPAGVGARLPNSVVESLVNSMASKVRKSTITFLPVNKQKKFGTASKLLMRVDVITESKDLKVLTMDSLIGNLRTYEMNRNQEVPKKEVKKDKSLALKMASGDTSDEEKDMAYLTRRFQKIVRKHGDGGTLQVRSSKSFVPHARTYAQNSDRAKWQAWHRVWLLHHQGVQAFGGTLGSRYCENSKIVFLLKHVG
ncbi:hypothetical protein MTR67_035523 [Solanum verrucosum]|uniref:Uncharacterized protein n=1 Tax=Solanum verrucosum TaxID=315347 RepID=A0AAF0ZLJ8_SOLVR|nr:hypothetical protein MTR67_035523 [Solanum verrucosum]